MSDSKHDDEFEAHLERHSPIHKEPTPPEHLEPPPELDRIVIGHARKAIQGGGPPARLYRAPKWALPATLATTILVSFTILLDLGVRAQRAEHEKQALPDRAAEVAPATPAAQPGADPLQASPAAQAMQPPRISTNPWPPLPSAAREPSPETARTRLARAEVAATRSRTDAESTAKEAAPGPAAWAAQIEELRSRGQAAEVERETKRFHEAYPGYVLPLEPPSTDGRTQ